MEYEAAVLIRDQVRGLKNSWVWTELVLPWLESKAASAMNDACMPGPNHPGHEQARYQLALLREFQAYLENLEKNAVEVAGEGKITTRDTGPNDPPAATGADATFAP